MKINLSVSLVDIVKGVRHSPCGCPVSNAFLRQYGVRASIGETSLFFSRDKFDVLEIPLPKLVKDFIRRFDRSAKVEPQSFIIYLPNKYKGLFNDQK